MTLDPTFKAKWVTALRSGLFKQTKNALKTADGHCCLGVACEVAGLASEPKAGHGCDYFIGPQGDKRWGKLPDDFAKDIGLSDSDGARLASMNDADNKSFSEIADYIESNL